MANNLKSPFIKNIIERVKIMNVKGSEYTTEFLNHSIFPENSIQELEIKQKIKNYKDSQNPITRPNRAIGSLMGLVIGDSYGHVAEFKRINYEYPYFSSLDPQIFTSDQGKNYFKLKPGQWTDDGSMALCLADSLLVNEGLNPVDLKARFLTWWCYGYNCSFRFDKERKDQRAFGMGDTVKEALRHYIDSDATAELVKGMRPNSSGNGTIMRLCPIPIYYCDELDFAIKNSALQSYSTHEGDEAADCSMILGYLTWKALNYQGNEGSSIKQFIDSLEIESELLPYLNTQTGKCIALSQQEENFEFDKYNQLESDRNWNWKYKNFEVSLTRSMQQPQYVGSYACDGLSMALNAVYTTESFHDCILKTVNLGGDADTVSAIAGQLAGAFYGVSGIQQKLIDSVMNWDNGGEIAARALFLENKKGKFQDEGGM